MLLVKLATKAIVAFEIQPNIHTHAFPFVDMSLATEATYLPIVSTRSAWEPHSL